MLEYLGSSSLLLPLEESIVSLFYVLEVYRVQTGVVSHLVWMVLDGQVLVGLPNLVGGRVGPDTKG